MKYKLKSSSIPEFWRKMIDWGGGGGSNPEKEKARTSLDSAASLQGKKEEYHMLKNFYLATFGFVCKMQQTCDCPAYDIYLYHVWISETCVSPVVFCPRLQNFFFFFKKNRFCGIGHASLPLPPLFRLRGNSQFSDSISFCKFRARGESEGENEHQASSSESGTASSHQSAEVLWSPEPI